MSRYFKSVESDDEKEDDGKTFTLPGSGTDFRSMRDKHTDVTFEIGTAKGGLDGEPLTPKKFEAHRIILSRHSKVFEAMLFGQFTEAKTDSIVLHHDPDAFGCLLNYMYGEESKGLALDVLLKVYELANQYQMEDFLRICSNFLKKTIQDIGRVDCVYPIYCAVWTFDHQLETACRYKIFDNLATVVKVNEIDQKSFHALIELMKSGYNYTDSYIYKAMLIWQEKHSAEIDKELWQKMLALLEISGFRVDELLSDKSLRAIFGAEVVLDEVSKRYDAIPKLGSKVKSPAIGELTVDSITFDGVHLLLNGKKYKTYEFDEIGFF